MSSLKINGFDLAPALSFVSAHHRLPKMTLFLEGAQAAGRISDLLSLGYASNTDCLGPEFT